MDLFQRQQTTNGGLSDDLDSLFVGGWQPDGANGTSAASWGRNDHSRDPPPGPDVCWDRDGNVVPLGLVDLDDEDGNSISMARFRQRTEVFDSLLAYLNPDAVQPSGNLLELLDESEV